MGSKSVSISHQPKKKCDPKKPSFVPNNIGGSWSFKGALPSKKTSADRAEYFAIRWVIKLNGKTKKTVRKKDKLKVGKTGSDSFSVNRKKFYPHFSTKVDRSKNKAAVQVKQKLTSFYYVVWARNTSKLGKKNAPVKAASEVYEFKAPDAPSIGGIEFDQFERKWACQVVAAANNPPKERYYTFYNKYHKYSWDSSKTSWVSDTPIGDYNLAKADVPSTQDSFTVSNTLPASFDAIGYDGWALIKVSAHSAGFAGDSTPTDKYRAFSYPDLVTIKSVDVTGLDQNYAWDGSKFVPVASDVRNGNIIVTVGLVNEITKVDGQNVHPIDRMTLQVLRNSSIKDPLQASLANGWADVDSGNSSTRAFTDLYSESNPDAGKVVWYRVVTVHDHLERYSMPYRATGLEWEPGKASLIDAIVVDDGVNPTGIKVLYGFNDDHMDGTQLEWSPHKNAFNSSTPPSTATHDKADANVNSLEKTTEINEQYGTSYAYTSQFYITGLEEGKDYYISARRYQDGGSGTGYGPRQWYMQGESVAAVSFARKPEDVSLTVPKVLTSLSGGAEVSWNFSSSVKQKSYVLYYVKAKKDSEGHVIYKDGSDIEAETEEKVLVTEKTEKMYAKLDQKQLETAIQDGTITLRVGVSCGGPESKSKNAKIVVASAPSLATRLDLESEESKFSLDGSNVTLTAQGGIVEYQVDQPGTNIFVSVVCAGKTVEAPDGTRTQANGDILYTGVIKDPIPNEWLTFSLPRCQFYDVAGYSVRMTPVSQSTGLQGEPRVLTFTVRWGHRAEPPSQLSYILGSHSDQTATIYPTRPDAEDYGDGDVFSESDVCDIYRVTPDGAYLIASGVQFGYSVTDPFAPFSNHTPLRYRLVTRTVDGDYNWTDIAYSVRGHAIRFDWYTDSGRLRTVSLPYNLRYYDKWHKQFEGVRDLSGGKSGWWLPGVDRTVSLTTDMVRLDNFEDQELVRELAQHSGSVFVRTPNGCAYEANVDVTDFPFDYDKLVCEVKFEAEEVDLTPTFTIQDETLS